MFLIATRNFPPDIGGIQSLMGGLAEGLLSHGPVEVFADEFKNSDSFDSESQMKIKRIKGIKLFKKYRKAKLINDFLKDNNNIRAIVFDHWKSLELIKTAHKKICLIHGKEINHEKGTNLNKRVLNVLNNVNYVIANSEYTKNLAISLGVLKDKIIIINPGVDPVKELDKESLSKVENLLEHKTPRLITVSRFDKRKNHEKIIMSLRNLKQIYPSIIYICIGYGDEEENLKKLVEELNLKEQVMFFKDISNELKNSLVSRSNIFVMPTIIYKKSIEGFGIAYIEAAQYGVPSIGGKDGGASDAIDHEKTGLICDGNNLNEIYSSINSMLENKKYLEYGKAAKENSVRFKWDKIIEEYKKILN